MSELLLERLEWAKKTALPLRERPEHQIPLIRPYLDDTIIRIPPHGKLWTPRPGYVLAAPEEFVALLGLVRAEGLDDGLDPDAAQRVKKHEDDHAEEFAKLDPEEILMGAEVVRLGWRKYAVAGYVTAAFGFEAPALAHAAVGMCPEDGPSPGDIQGVRAMGYLGDLKEVGRRIEAWNAAGRKPYISLPKTYVPRRSATTS